LLLIRHCSFPLGCVEAELTACRRDDAGRNSATHLRYHPAVPRDRCAGPHRSWGWSGETNLELATLTWARPERYAVNQTDRVTPRAKSRGINGRHHGQLATLRSQDRSLLAEATTDSVDAVTTKVAGGASRPHERSERPATVGLHGRRVPDRCLPARELSEATPMVAVAFSSLSWCGRSIGPRANKPRNKLWSSKAASCILWRTSIGAGCAVPQQCSLRTISRASRQT